MTMIQYTFRLDAKQLEALQEEYAQTYSEHRLSFNAWAVKRMVNSSSKPPAPGALE